MNNIIFPIKKCVINIIIFYNIAKYKEKLLKNTFASHELQSMPYTQC